MQAQDPKWGFLCSQSEEPEGEGAEQAYDVDSAADSP